MSYIRLIIKDRTQTISGEVHGYLGDGFVAALTAEPETVHELELALARFVKPPSESSPFAGFREGEDLEPYDSGVMVIDLVARVVAVDSTYSQPSAAGSFRVQSEFADEDALVPYRLSDDWLIVNSVPEYEGVCGRRREARLAIAAFDARDVLFGKALLQFIVRECSEARDSADEEFFTKIHLKWLMAPREDLQGKTPREVLLEKQDFIDFDLHSRALQWSFTKECPPPLPPESHAYRFSGFGTHEFVIYYELVRYLLGACLEQARSGMSLDGEIERLDLLKDVWLSEPNSEYISKTPAHFIEWERKRVNVTISAHEAIIDDDCEICQAMAADFDTPGFWHLDGCNMDEGFEFSSYKTREEYDEEERSREEWRREFDRDWNAGKYNTPFDESRVDLDGETPF